MENFELVYELNRAANTLNSYIDAAIANKSGLTRAQCVALLLIVQHAGLSRADLARKLNCSHVAVRRLVSILAGKGYVTYTQAKQDARILQLHPTEAGKIMIQHVVEAFQLQSADAFARIRREVDTKALSDELHTFTETLVFCKGQTSKTRQPES